MSDPIYFDDWENLTSYVITNLFLYGTTTAPATPEDAFRTTQEYADVPVVQIEMDSFMAYGPGRYAYPTNAKVVQDFFEGTGGLSSLPNGTYTQSDLINSYGYTADDFVFSINQVTVQSGSLDYGQRAYVFGNGKYEINDDAAFVVDGSNRYVEDMAVHAKWDDFDFESKWLNQLINDIYLKDKVDPYDIGRTIEIQIINKQNVPVDSVYDSTDYNDDVIPAV